MYTTIAAKALLMISEGTSLEEAVLWLTRNTPRNLKKNARTQIKMEVILALAS